MKDVEKTRDFTVAVKSDRAEREEQHPRVVKAEMSY